MSASSLKNTDLLVQCMDYFFLAVNTNSSNVVGSRCERLI